MRWVLLAILMLLALIGALFMTDALVATLEHP